MKANISSIGVSTPKNVFFQSELPDTISERLNLDIIKRKILKSVYGSSGIDTRKFVLTKEEYIDLFPDNPSKPFPSTSTRMEIYQKYAADLAVEAIKDCLTPQTECVPNMITHLITVSCTGMYAPGIDIDIINKLNLSPNTKRTTINFMGCYGAFNGLKVAESICLSDPSANVLVVCIELCSIHFQYKKNMGSLVSSALFSDGAAAALIQKKSLQKQKFEIANFHCDLVPQTSSQMAWTIGDSGFDIVLSSYVPQAIQSGISSFANTLYNKLGASIEKNDLYAIHPGGIKILEACETELAISKEQNKYAYQTLKNNGNMSSATILFVLKAMWDSLNDTDNDRSIFCCAFGPGLTLESMLLKVKIT